VDARPRFDYDQEDMPRAYASGRALRPEQLALWTGLLREALRAVSVRRILDLGCGVGRFTGLLREIFGAPVSGLDRSERMLEVATSTPAPGGISFVRASAEELPLRDDRIDLVFVFLVYHHLLDRPAALQECARVLTRDGVVFLVNSTIESLDSYLWLPFFPSARGIDVARLPDRATLGRTARAAGLGLLGHRTVMNPVSPSLRAYAGRIASRAISSLRLVPDDEFARGIAEFRRYCECEDRGQAVEEAIDLFHFRRAR
jgi:SAM-dependent methyltransferase